MVGLAWQILKKMGFLNNKTVEEANEICKTKSNLFKRIEFEAFKN
ncbi:MAG: hypothetical protein JWQ30_1268 [Sediminibacterium sp.]|nr:hypothetical protein [Sediminibacterium sp.]